MTATRNFEAKNIIVGAATFYVGPVGVENTKISLTGSAQTAQDPTKVNYDTDGAKWNHLGYTQNGVTMNIEPTYGEVMVDQLLDIAKMFKSGQRVTVATSLTETTLENLYVAIGARTGVSGDLRVASSHSGVNLDLLSQDTYTAFNIADGSSSVHFSASTSTNQSALAGSAVAILDINGGALGYEPVERSVCFVGPGPSKLATGTQKAERIYIGYRAVSMDPVGIAVQRDNVTLFPVNFRMLPSETNSANDGNAAYGKIIDRVY